MAGLPTPRNSTDRYLAAIHDVLGEIRDRLPAPHVQVRVGDGVELREPAAPPGGGTPSPARGGGGPGATARRPARTPTKTTAAAGRKSTTKPKEK